MDAQKQNSAPKVTKESKNKIKVDFERSPLKDRLKAKFINIYFLQNVIFKLSDLYFCSA